MKRFSKVSSNELVSVIITETYNTLGINTDIQQLYVDCSSAVREFHLTGYSNNTPKSVEKYIELVLPITISNTIKMSDAMKGTSITTDLHFFYNRLLDFISPVYDKLEMM